MPQDETERRTERRQRQRQRVRDKSPCFTAALPCIAVVAWKEAGRHALGEGGGGGEDSGGAGAEVSMGACGCGGVRGGHGGVVGEGEGAGRYWGTGCVNVGTWEGVRQVEGMDA